MKKGKLTFILSMTIILSLLLFRPINFDQGHEDVHKNFAPPKPGTCTEGNYLDGSIKEIKITQDGVNSSLSPQMSLSQDEIDKINDGKAEKVLVIPVGFIDEQFDPLHDKTHFIGIMEQMKKYYELNSGYIENNSGITIDYYVSDFLELDPFYSMSYFGADGAEIDGFNGPVYELVRQAVIKLDAIDSSFDFSEYDTDGDNVIDHLIIIHAGIGQEEESTNTDLIWSHQWYIGGSNDYTLGQAVDGVYAHNYTTVPETGKLGVFAHEFGHDLGLPDLYDTNKLTDGYSEGAGVWDLMANGSWNCIPGNEAGTSPSNLSAWSRTFLGWEAPNLVINNQLDSSVENTNGISSIIKVYPKGDLSHEEHYLIEYRRKIGDYDSALPEEGVLIWHIDDYVINYVISDELGTYLDNNVINIIASLPGVVFEHADGTIDFGDSGDPFPGSSNNYNFTYMPYGLNMDDRNNEYTYVDILDINVAGDSATFDIYVEENAPIKPTVIAPVQGDITTAMPTFTWNIVPQAQEYIIQIATDNIFETVVFETSLNNIQADVNGLCSYTLDEISGEILKDGVPLYWRIAVTNATNSGDISKYVWSDVYQFTIPIKLNTPINLSANELILGELDITWNPVIGATKYLLEVDGEVVNSINTTYIDTNLILPSTHTYKVMAVSDNNVSSWSAAYVITTQDEATISLDCSGVEEGKEDGSEIIVDISSKDGEFINSLTKDDITIDGLPDGVTISSLDLKGTTTSATITLSGNSIGDYDENKVVTVTIAKDKFIPQQLTALTDTDEIVATVETTPDVPTGITFSIFGTDANKLMGTDTTMEFSIDGGSTYNDITAANMELTTELSSLSVENDILVRYKANSRIPASDYIEIDLSPSSISADFSTAVVEGSEDGSEIIIEIQSNSRFDGLLVDDIIIDGLPAGIAKNTMTINSPTSVSILLSGNSTGDYDEDQEVAVSIAKNKFIPQQSNELTDSAIMVAINEAPNGITFTFDGNDANKLMGTDESMEFSIDGGSTYVTITGNDFEIATEYLNTLSGDNDILVRSKATSTTPASTYQTIDLLSNTNILTLTHDDSANTIMGMTTNMEFSSNNGLTWVKYIDESSLPDLSNNITILVRYYRAGTTVHSDSICFEFTKPAPPPVVPAPAPVLPLPVPEPEPIVEGVEIPLSVIGESSSEEQIIVRISNEDEDEPIVFTEDLFKAVNKVKKDIVIEKEELSLSLPPGAIDANLFEAVDAVFTIEMDQIPPQDVKDKLDKAEQNDGKGLFKIDGLVFEFEAQVVSENTTTPITEFEKDVTIAISLDNTSISADDKGKLGIYWFNEAKEKWEYMGGDYDPVTNSIIFTTGHFSTYSIFRFEKSFMDIQNHWAKNEIEQLASMRIIKGKSEDVFDPNATITRAEFTALIVRTLGLSVDNYTVETPFEDVINNKWYYKEIGFAYNAGLLPNKYSKVYDPYTPISREDMVIIMSNALQLKNGLITMNDTDIQSILDGYTDIAGLDSEAIKAVAIAVNEGIIQGRTLTTIVPEGNLLRAEAAVVIKRLLGIIE